MFQENSIIHIELSWTANIMSFISFLKFSVSSLHLIVFSHLSKSHLYTSGALVHLCEGVWLFYTADITQSSPMCFFIFYFFIYRTTVMPLREFVSVTKLPTRACANQI